MRERLCLSLVIVAYLIFSLLYNVATPYRQVGYMKHQRGADGRPLVVQDIGAPDELQHANYVATLQSGKGVPVLKPGAPDLYETYQSHQPPLYYFIASAWATLWSMDPTTVHDGPYLRGLNSIIGAISLVLLFVAVKFGTGDRLIAVAAAAICGLMPMWVALHAAVSNDPLLFCFGTAYLAAMAGVLRSGWNPSRAILIGVILGLGLWTKTSALAFVLVSLVGAVCRWGESKQAWLRWLPAAIALVIIAPWWIRNTQVYGDPLAMGAFKAAFVGSAQRSNLVAMLGGGFGAEWTYWTQWFGWWTIRSFFGVFGQMDLFYDPIFYALALVGSLACVAGWASSWRTVEAGCERTFRWLCVTCCIVVAMLFLQFNLTYFQAQARYLYPAMGAISAGFAMGYVHWTKRSFAAWVILFVVLLAANWATVQFLTNEFAVRTGR